MSAEIRAKLLLVLDEHSRVKRAAYESDESLIAETGQPAAEILRQLEFLALEDLVDLSKPLDGKSFSVRIKPKGSLAAEQIRESAKRPPQRPMGFQ